MTDIDVRPSVPTRRRSVGGAPRNRPPTTDTPTTEATVDGLLDLADGKAWLRVGGYAPGPGDIPLSPGQVRSLGLRAGDHVTGVARTNGHRPATLHPDTVNGAGPASAAARPDFYALTAVHPYRRLRLEHRPDELITRVIDLVMPIGKGQRALIVAPPKAGKTIVLQAMATAITRNNPECHVIVVLVDERPEEVTDMRRSVRGEVAAATFDRPPHEHTAVAELAIERAKRLVESGRDVVVLLDSITRLARAYNLGAPARGRTLSGGLDSTAVYPPKRFLGAARAIEDGGSLTIIATALVENGSAMDTVIFEEFKSTGNAELKLDRTIAEGRVYPAVDIAASGTRHDEILLMPDELLLTYRLRRALGAQDKRQALQQVLAQLRGTATNAEFLEHVGTLLDQRQKA
jgi:transcription termination factor Rho